MAFTSIVRRGYASVFPIAISRSVATGRKAFLGAISAIPSDGKGVRRRFIPFLGFSTAASELPVADDAANLVGVADSEIKSIKDMVIDIPDGFPFGIKGTYKRNIQLIRKYHDEVIKVNTYVPDDRNVVDDDDQNQNQNQNNVPPSFRLHVIISKVNVESLDFGLTTTYPNEIAIDTIGTYTTPCYAKVQQGFLLVNVQQDFNDLNENLQKAFRIYLEIRGITPSLMDFLFDSMRKGDKTKYLFWLKNVKSFMEN